MADPVTIADIYALFQTSQAQADRRAAEIDHCIAELNAEADRRLQQLERVAANTSRENDALRPIRSLN